MATLCPRCETKNLSRIDDDQWACFRCGWAEDGHPYSGSSQPSTSVFQRSTSPSEPTSLWWGQDGRRYPSTVLNVEADPRFTSAHVLWRPDAEIL